MKLPINYKLLEAGVNVVLVTAAGYGYHVEKYEARLTGLLAYLVQERVSADAMERFLGLQVRARQGSHAEFRTDRKTNSLLHTPASEDPSRALLYGRAAPARGRSASRQIRNRLETGARDGPALCCGADDGLEVLDPRIVHGLLGLWFGDAAPDLLQLLSGSAAAAQSLPRRRFAVPTRVFNSTHVTTDTAGTVGRTAR